MEGAERFHALFLAIGRYFVGEKRKGKRRKKRRRKCLTGCARGIRRKRLTRTPAQFGVQMHASLSTNKAPYGTIGYYGAVASGIE